MSSPYLPVEELLPEPPTPSEPSRAGWVARLAVGVIGAVALIVAAVCTLGAALGAAVGMLAARSMARGRRRPLTRRSSWVGAVAAAGLSLLVAGGLVVVSLPSSTRSQFARTLDSASVESNKAPPPAWAERIAPGSHATSRAQQTVLGPGITKAIGIWGAAMGTMLVLVFFSVIFGTAGWIAGLLLAFACTGRWISGGGPIALSA
jgi:hypothetical protein